MISQNALQSFQDEMGKVLNDPYKACCKWLSFIQYCSYVTKFEMNVVHLLFV